MGRHHDPDDLDLDHEDLDDDLGRPVYHGDGLSVRELSPRSSSGSWTPTPVSRPGCLAAAGPPWTHRGTPMRFPDPSGWDRDGARRASHRQPRSPRPLRPGRLSAAARARAGRLDPQPGLAGTAGRRRRDHRRRACCPGRPAAGRAGRPGCRGAGWLAAAVPPLRASAHVAARRPRRAPHRPAAGPPDRRRLRGLPRPGRPRLGREPGSPGHRQVGRVRHRHQAVDGRGLSGRRRAGLAQPLPPRPHPGDSRWEADTVGRLLGTRAAALLCVHGARIQGGGLDTQGVAIVPAHLLRGALRDDPVLSDADVELLATTARRRLCPAA